MVCEEHRCEHATGPSLQATRYPSVAVPPACVAGRAAQLAMEFLATALAADRRRKQSSALADVVPPQGIAELVKDDPTRWEGMLW